ncbi:MAG: TatD family hydrolase [Clostridia bacterium]|nr:TatD family hydrolase [Clostridia bacterium]
MELPLFDSHAHYFDRRFETDPDSPGAHAILQEQVFGGGVCGVINVGTNYDNNLVCIAQAARYPKMFAAVGLHPEDVFYMTRPMEEELSCLEALLDTEPKRKQAKIVALGEIGLDYHDHGHPVPKEKQQQYFEAQMELASRLSLPVIIHDREAHGDCFETVLRYPSVRGVFHSYSGSAEMAKELIKRGWYLSFSGVVSFRNAARVAEVAASVPDEALLIETDCPYLAPHPYRGRMNHSGYLIHTAEALARIRGCDTETVAAVTRENVRCLFGV